MANGKAAPVRAVASERGLVDTAERRQAGQQELRRLLERVGDNPDALAQVVALIERLAPPRS